MLLIRNWKAYGSNHKWQRKESLWPGSKTRKCFGKPNSSSWGISIADVIITFFCSRKWVVRLNRQWFYQYMKRPNGKSLTSSMWRWYMDIFTFFCLFKKKVHCTAGSLKKWNFEKKKKYLVKQVSTAEKYKTKTVQSFQWSWSSLAPSRQRYHVWHTTMWDVQMSLHVHFSALITAQANRAMLELNCGPMASCANKQKQKKKSLNKTIENAFRRDNPSVRQCVCQDPTHTCVRPKRQ